MSDARLTQLHTWAESSLDAKLQITPVSGDASFRRYFRAHDITSNTCLIAMDAPPQKENSEPFVRLCKLMKESGIPVPDIVSLDLHQGFMLLEDFGDTQLLHQLKPDSADTLYQKSLDVLFSIQQQCDHDDLPAYDETLLLNEMALFKDWFLQKHLGILLSDEEAHELETVQKVLVDNALAQPSVFVHRDYHSRNLMITDNCEGIGVIDFQDAVSGPVTYDIVSLLRDCYIAWPQEKIDQWLNTYFEKLHSAKLLNADFATFKKWFDFMGVQRHMKAIGIFARLNHRDDKPGYLNDIPRTLKYIIDVSDSYEELASLNTLSNKILLCLESKAAS